MINITAVKCDCNDVHIVYKNEISTYTFMSYNVTSCVTLHSHVYHITEYSLDNKLM